MLEKFGFVLAIVLFAAFAYIIATVFYDDAGLVMSRRFTDLIEWLAFWR